MRTGEVGYGVTMSAVEVHFDLPRDGRDWPPVEVESLWGETVGGDVVRLTNVPWFVRGVSSGDLVRVEADADGVLWAAEHLEGSGSCTIRVVPSHSGPLRGSHQRVLDAFEPFGVTGEGIQEYGLVALEVPPTADLAGVQRVLRAGARDGWWDYEEGCVSDAWTAVARGTSAKPVQ
ncbi:DUF4265 domain-containing protein [Actinoplanes philippinensis]|uniref:DUF4265 domain-containing protein n=1 Tax=Actinoplanes philippinensis TaxID=35752 RepID=UPI00340382B2